MTSAAYRAFVSQILYKLRDGTVASDAGRALHAFPALPGDNRAQASEVLGDYAFHCVAREVARSVAKQGSNAYVYRFDAMSQNRSVQDGVWHGAELAFVWFGYLEDGDPDPFTADQIRLSNRMMDSWTKFATSGRPTSDDAGWPRYSAQRDVAAVLRPIANGQPEGFETEENWHHWQCGVWSDLYFPDGSESDTRVV